MYRFLALSWDTSNARAMAEVRRCRALPCASGWPSSIEAPGLSIYHDWPRDGPWRAWRLPANVGVVLGRLFIREQSHGEDLSAVELDAAAAERMAATDGRSLIDRYWGTYVAFLADRRHRTRVVLRSVGAGIACYRLRHSGLSVFFSDLADVAALGIEALNLDRDALAGFLCNSQMAVRRTALMDVTEVLAGECLRHGLAAEQREMYWRPAPFCEHGRMTEGAAHAEELRTKTQHCIDAWSSVHRHVLLQLSGGLDSAIVVGCLQRARPPPAVTCFNRFSEHPGEDERRFARAAAQRAGVPLAERAWDDEDFDLERRLGEPPIAPKPTIPELLQIDARAATELLASSGAETCWTGQGGDHLFFQFETPLIVADYLWRGRRFADVRTVMRDTARLSRQSYWALSALAARALVARRAETLVGPIEPDASFIAPEIVRHATVSQADHPWMNDLRAVAPGKQFQVRQLIELLHRHVPYVRSAPAPDVHPLISLPLIEHCLALPTWIAVRGGRNRALARLAFADRLPESIRERESKGSTGWFLAAMLRQHAAEIRPLLLDGTLMRDGWLNRKAVERYLLQSQPLRHGQLLSLLACLAAEVWLNARKARQRSYCRASTGSEASMPCNQN